MKVEVVDKKVFKQKLELGDVIVYNDGSAYLVTKECSISNKYCYIAKSFDGYSGAFGIQESLEELSKAFQSLASNATVYKPAEYKLQLVKKG